MRASTFLLFLAAFLAVIVSTAPRSDAALAMADSEALKSDNRLSLSLRQDNDVSKAIEPQTELPSPLHEAFSKTPFEYNTTGGYPAIPTSMADINPVQGGVINTNSIQILYRRTKNRYDWVFFQGVQGVAVNPCGDSRFQLRSNNVQERRRPPSFDDPPVPSKGIKVETFPIPPFTKPCRYEAEGNGPGWLKCGDFLIYEFLPDPQRKDNTIKCGWEDGSPEYKRAWYVDY